MRKIISQAEKERKKKRNTTIISLILLAIMVMSTVGYSFLNRLESAENKNTNEKIVNTGNGYLVKFQGENLLFMNSPESVKEIPIKITATLNTFYQSNLYVASDNQAVIQEIGINLGKYVSRMQEACYGACDKDLPEKDCTENLIVWKDSTEMKVYQNQSCIFIEGDMRAVDAFLYKIFGFI